MGVAHVTRLIDAFGLHGKVAITTGASSGIGVATSLALAEAGASVVVVGRRETLLQQTEAKVRAKGVAALAVAADVTDPRQCTDVVDKAMSIFGRVDVLVNNAGVGGARPATRETPDEFRSVIDVNLNGSYWMSQACGRVMLPGSSIINISSVLGLRTFALPQAAYSSSKAALIGLTRDLSSQWAGRKGIRVNAIAPGIFPTEMTEEFSAETIERICSQTPMGRVGATGELSGAIVFLASSAASYITGVTLPVDGGWSAP
jgi:NAD(P)-dependent dehydrogenase (short-subunit alcohol dehydrogenase family)